MKENNLEPKDSKIYKDLWTHNIKGQQTKIILYTYLSSLLQVTAPQITIKCDVSVTFIIHLHSFRRSNIFKTIY